MAHGIPIPGGKEALTVGSRQLPIGAAVTLLIFPQLSPERSHPTDVLEISEKRIWGIHPIDSRVGWRFLSAMPKSPELKHHIASLRKLILATEQNLEEMKAFVAELELRSEDSKARLWNHQSSSAKIPPKLQRL